jgi:EVE domain
VACYINLFTAETWREGRENAKFAYTGHRKGAHNRAKVKPGDTLLCYVTKASVFVGAMKVTSGVYEIEDEDPRTWVSELYPVRFKTELLVRVPVVKGVSLGAIRAHSADPAKWG